MPLKNKLQAQLKSLQPLLAETYKVKRIGVFGSHALGEATKRSDIDILVEFAEPIGGEFIDLKEFFEDQLGCKVDLVTAEALKPQLKDLILEQVVYL
jgi:predicted nucleotidyltransferase